MGITTGKVSHELNFSVLSSVTFIRRLSEILKAGCAYRPILERSREIAGHLADIIKSLE